MKQEMLINVSQPEECRIAIVEDGVLEELYIERSSQDNYVGNIYKGRVVNLEPSIQAAFVDFGVGRNGFLHISDVEPQYFRQGGFDPYKPIELQGASRGERERVRSAESNGGGNGDADLDDIADEDFGEGGPQGGPQRRHGKRGFRPGARPRVKPPIQDILRRGDEVLVQVIKEGIGTKGPTLYSGWAMPINAWARSATDLPFRFTMPYSVTTYITSVRGVVTTFPGVSVDTIRLRRPPSFS